MPKLTFNLTEEQKKQLDDKAAREGTTITAAMKLAIRHYAFLERKRDEGYEVVVEKKGEKRMIILF